MAGFFLGDEAARAVGGFGARLCGEERLQLEGLLDVEGGEFVAGLGYPFVDESRNPVYRLFLG